ncbi:hypothetical protein [Pararhodobacter zhoushanensis]|uniref:Uncharacterized protein n=1 Tax=Pararhodobacter zhoushanensis TaxID=2479545 RepID=A0ABT3GV15_9RHOB|nr:hypothetical protein [Pararhodobacter zhoushanensis]MCW1931335.1 hypothetical protein [Pararhodobacter zhoushanensis]
MLLALSLTAAGLLIVHLLTVLLTLRRDHPRAPGAPQHRRAARHAVAPGAWAGCL